MEIDKPPGVSGSTQLQNFRENMKVRRDALGISQTALAESMNKRGHAFRQQTIQKIESGGRPLSLVEAVDLALELDIEMDKLAASPVLVDAYLQFQERMTNLLRLVNTALQAEDEWHSEFPEAKALQAQLESMNAETQLAGNDRAFYIAMTSDLREWAEAGSPRRAFQRALKLPSDETHDSAP